MATTAKQDKPVLKAYPTQHLWIITVPTLIGDLNKQLHMFNCQKALAQELLMKMQHQPFASNCMFSALLGEFSNIGNLYKLYEPIIQIAIQLLRNKPVTDKLSTHKRNILPFLAGTLYWLPGTATTKDTMEIKQWVNSLIQKQIQQQETLVHIISILNITIYATQVKWQKINKIMDALQKANQDMNIL